MDKLRPIKRTCNEDDRTKPKLPNNKISGDDKPTLSIRNKAQNTITSKLLEQSATISQESSHNFQSASQSVIQIDPLCVEGNISNLTIIDERIMKKYNIHNGWMFEVEDYLVIFTGRHQIQFKNGMPVALYVPPIFKSPINSQTRKVEVLIQRKIKNQMNDPMQYPYIVIDPHNSVYPTYICTWIECKRKITLQHYIEYNQKANEPMILGNCIHKYLQWLIRGQTPTQIPTQVQMKRLYTQFLYEMFLIDLHFDIFVEKIQNGIVNLTEWYQKYVINQFTIELNKWERKYLKISRVLGSQVMIKSQYFGMRGKVDALFEGEYWDEKLQITKRVAIPFELKTGKKVLDSHKKQIDMYNLLVRQNLKMPVLGLLYYSESSALQHRQQNALVCFQNVNIHRNKIIINILNLYSDCSTINLPLLPQTFDQCKLCDVTIECAVNRLQPEAIKDLQDVTQDCPEKYNKDIRQRISKLSVLQIAYLKKWTYFLHLQEWQQKMNNNENRKKHFYNKLKLNSKEMQNFINFKEGQPLKFKVYKLIDSHQMSQEIQKYFQVGEKLRIFMPIIRLADACRIISNNKTTKKFQMEVEIKSDSIKFNRNKCGFILQDDQVECIQVELQKYENSFYNYTRGYCYKFVAEAESWLKQIIIQQKQLKNEVQDKKIQEEQKVNIGLNDDQMRAFRKCISMQRFCLVEGMPGTGKTQLILKLAQHFFKEGKTILITSYTNQALANILDREINQEKQIPLDCMIREGSRFGINCYENLSSQSQQLQAIESYKTYFSTKKVWFVTISSLYIQHLPEKFDIVIVDEASQCLQANCLQALLKANKFILIGDQNQLQPMVKSKQAIAKGMQISLFERLCTLYKQEKMTLKKQYRMSPAIMKLTNSLVYNGQLELADEKIAIRKLEIVQKWKQIVPTFLHDVIDPSKTLRFINYDNIINLVDDAKTDLRRIKRLLQLKITCCLYKQFRNAGVQRKDILIISAYNSLVHQIVGALKKQGLVQKNSGDVLTIDKSQGTDKEVIIFIFHQGNKELIENYRRLNVALTRAKNKFIIVGSHKELKNLATWTGRLAQILTPDKIDIQPDFLQGILSDSSQI